MGHPDRGSWVQTEWERGKENRRLGRRTSETVQDRAKVTIDHEQKVVQPLSATKATTLGDFTFWLDLI